MIQVHTFDLWLRWEQRFPVRIGGGLKWLKLQRNRWILLSGATVFLTT